MVEELTDCIRTVLTAPDICRPPGGALSRPVRIRACRGQSVLDGMCLPGRAKHPPPIHDHYRVCALVPATERARRALLASLR
jgi:hypothetical protein